MAQIHAPSEAARWLLTHRFKTTKIKILVEREVGGRDANGIADRQGALT
jgi:hypothetical protein